MGINIMVRQFVLICAFPLAAFAAGAPALQPTEQTVVGCWESLAGEPGQPVIREFRADKTVQAYAQNGEKLPALDGLTWRLDGVKVVMERKTGNPPAASTFVDYNVMDWSAEGLGQARRVPAPGLRKLMITAHPDDESIFCGGEVLGGGYYVVCITSGDQVNRRKDFEETQKIAGMAGEMWNYGSWNKTMDGEAVWTDEDIGQIKKKLKSLLERQAWDKIITHNPEGEYGHTHHKIISKTMTGLVADRTKLFYIGKFVGDKTFAKAKDQLPQVLDDAQVQRKTALISHYYQDFTSERDWIKACFSHWYGREQMVPAGEWKTHAAAVAKIIDDATAANP
jgi:LmbE family N-acetylglucosaminyl deacetylase